MIRCRRRCYIIESSQNFGGNHHFPPEQHVFESFENIFKSESEELEIHEHVVGDQKWFLTALDRSQYILRELELSRKCSAHALACWFQVSSKVMQRNPSIFFPTRNSAKMRDLAIGTGIRWLSHFLMDWEVFPYIYDFNENVVAKSLLLHFGSLFKCM